MVEELKTKTKYCKIEMVKSDVFSEIIKSFRHVRHVTLVFKEPLEFFVPIQSKTERNCTYNLSRHMGKPTICIGENKGADQLRSNYEADQHLCNCYMDSTIPLLSKSKISSCYMDSTIPLLSKSKISSFQPASVLVQLGLCRTCSETTLLGFSTRRLILLCILQPN